MEPLLPAIPEEQSDENHSSGALCLGSNPNSATYLLCDLEQVH